MVQKEEDKPVYQDHVSQTIRSYDLNAIEFSRKKTYPDELLKQMLLFSKLSRKGTILDLGSGNGDDAKLFRKLGHNVTCVELSSEMEKRCRSKGFKTSCQDIRSLQFRPNSFDAAWANMSLLHLKKDEARQSLKKIRSILKRTGYLGIIMQEGKGDAIDIDDDFFPNRHFSFFTKHELDQFLSEDFTILKSRVLSDKGRYYFSYILKNRKV